FCKPAQKHKPCASFSTQAGERVEAGEEATKGAEETYGRTKAFSRRRGTASATHLTVSCPVRPPLSNVALGQKRPRYLRADIRRRGEAMFGPIAAPSRRMSLYPWKANIRPLIENR